MKKIAILQSNYIPWKGYFDIIKQVDEFILYDDMQFTRRDWRNRNKVKTASGLLWLTIPVEVKGKFEQKICDTKISDKNWAKEHFNSIHHHYAKAKCFKRYKTWLEEVYIQAGKEDYLSKVNYLFLKEICSLLNIETKISWSMDYFAVGTKTERLISICQQTKATHYLSGPSAKNYIIEDEFSNRNIHLEWMSYSGYQEYEQLFPPFEHGVTILDLILNVGESSNQFLLNRK